MITQQDEFTLLREEVAKHLGRDDAEYAFDARDMRALRDVACACWQQLPVSLLEQLELSTEADRLEFVLEGVGR